MMRRYLPSDRRGLTLVELLLGSSLLLAGSGALLLGMNYSMLHTEYLSQLQTATNAAQGELEQFMATPVETLWTDERFALARAGRQCLGEDANCDGDLDVAEGEDMNGDGVLTPGPLAALPNGRVVVQIRPVDFQNPADPALLDVHVAACWSHRGRPIGEASCADGADANGWVDSPAAVSTRLSREER